MYDMIHTDNDRLKEDYIFCAELSEHGYPHLPCVDELVEDGLEPVALHYSSRAEHPDRSICHMFIDDNLMESLWNQPHKQLETLKRFKWVCSPDFSCWGSMPEPLQKYNKYRIHALSWYLLMNDVNIIPTVTWNNINSYEWCFEGVPKHSVVALSSNGILSQKESFIRGFDEMCRVLEPRQIVWFGRPIDVDCKCPIVYFDSFGQQMNRRIEDGWKSGCVHREEWQKIQKKKSTR